MGRLYDVDKGHFPKAAPGTAGTDPELLGGTRQSIKAIRNPRAVTVADAVAELREVYSALDREDLVPTERTWLSRRRRVLQRRVAGQSPRYMVVGARVGGLTVAERDMYRAQKAKLAIINMVGAAR